jgi:RNA polymerase sigma-70 factor (ECF subfamily)
MATATIHIADLITRLRQGERTAQHELYRLYAGRMLTVCKRYLGNGPEAEDVLLESMMLVFQKIDQYDGTGPLEAWIRRLVVNQALQVLRKRHILYVELGGSDDNSGTQPITEHPSPDSQLSAAELMELVAQLPDGYRTVFNLYAIEGYSHQEIAEQLSIAIGTSKSQLNRARAMLQSWVGQAFYQHKY